MGGCLVIRVLVFSVFCIVCTVLFYCFVYVYLLLFLLSVLGYGLLPPSDNSIAVSNNSNNNNNNSNKIITGKTKLLLMNIELISQTFPPP